MVDAAKFATACSVLISLLMIGICISVVVLLRNDIHELQLDFMAGMKEFSVIATVNFYPHYVQFAPLQNITNDAWDEMMSVQKLTPPSVIKQLDSPPVEPLVARQRIEPLDQKAFDSFFRSSRQTELPKHCKCGLQPNNCLPGPPGPAGVPGTDGAPGGIGAPGAQGMSGSALEEVLYPKECIKCPIGIPGAKGPIGLPGPPGPNGSNGTPGIPKGKGKKGQPGVPGTEGEGGPDGLPGSPGPAGKDGVIVKPGLPGVKGNPGAPGEAGPPGDAGTKQDGKPGAVGLPGQPGRPGIPGAKGTDGKPGSPGIPGHDAQYCPCPRRGSVFETVKRYAAYYE